MLTVRYWAAAKAAAGIAEDVVEGARTLADVLTEVRSQHDRRFTEVLTRCSFVIDGDPVGTRDHACVELADGALIDCLPPFAGG